MARQRFHSGPQTVRGEVVWRWHLVGVTPQDAGLLGGELLLGQDSLLLEGRQLLQLGNQIGRGQRPPSRRLLRLRLLTARHATGTPRLPSRPHHLRAALRPL